MPIIKSDIMEIKTDEDVENPGTFLYCDPKITLSLMRSSIRRSVLLYLYEIYPFSSYPAEIARAINAYPMSVIGALKGSQRRYDTSNSLLILGLVYAVDDNQTTFYKLSELGKEVCNILKKV